MPNGPWDEYQEKSASVAAPTGPWQQYQEGQGKLASSDIQEEMHPDLSAADRLLIKNFSNSPEVSVRYLKQKYPDMEVRDEGGRLLMRKPGEAKFRPLDPETGFFSKDLPYDIGDVAYDVGSGVAQGAATALGGALGLGAGGVPALPAAMASGAAASAGTEALRQKLGQYLGLPQELDPAQVAVSGAVGGALPAGGAGLKGAYNYATRTAAPAIAQAVSGVPKEAFKTLGKQFDKIKELENTGVMDMVSEAHSGLVQKLGGLKNEVGKRLEESLDAAGMKVNIGAAKQQLKDFLEQVKQYKSEIDNPALREEIENIQKTFNRLFTKAGTEGEEIADEVSARAAFHLQQELKDVADLTRLGEGVTSRFGKNATQGEKKLAEVARGGYQALNNEFERVTGGVSKQLKDQYREYSGIQKTLQPFFSSPEKTFSTLSNLNAKSRIPLFEKLGELQAKYGVDVFEQAKLLEAYSHFGKPALNAVNGLGTTSTSRTVPLSIALGSLGSLAGYKLGGGYAGATLGGALGAAAGSAIGSPATLKQGVRLGLGAEKLAEKLLPRSSVRQGMAKSLWEASRPRDE